MAEAVAALVPVSDAPDAPRELAAYVVRSVPSEDRDDDGRDARPWRDGCTSSCRHRLPGYMVPCVPRHRRRAADHAQRKGRPQAAARPASAGAPRAQRVRSWPPRASWRSRYARRGPRRSASNRSRCRSRRTSSPTWAGTRCSRRGSCRCCAPARSARARRSATSTATRRSVAWPRTRRVHRSSGLTAPPRPAPLRHDSRRIAAAGAGQAVVIYLLLLLITLPVSYVYTWNNGHVSVEVLVQLMMRDPGQLSRRAVGRAGAARPADGRRHPARPIPAVGLDLCPALDAEPAAGDRADGGAQRFAADGDCTCGCSAPGSAPGPPSRPARSACPP